MKLDMQLTYKKIKSHTRFLRTKRTKGDMTSCSRAFRKNAEEGSTSSQLTKSLECNAWKLL